jgi:hypothetical protein
MSEQIDIMFINESDINNLVEIKKELINTFIAGKSDKNNNYHFEFLSMKAFQHFEEITENIINSADENNYNIVIKIHTNDNINSLNDNYKKKLSKLKINYDDSDYKKIILSK